MITNLQVLMVQGAMAVTRIHAGWAKEDALRQVASDVMRLLGRSKQSAIDMVGPGMALVWAQCGFPCVEVGHKLAASLMLTSASAEVVDSMELPWRCFAIRVPDKLVDTPEQPDPCFLLVLRPQAEPTRVRVLSFSSKTLSIWNDTLGDLTNWDVNTKDTERSANADFLVDDDACARRDRLLGRLLVGVCLEFDAIPCKSDPLTSDRGKSKRRSDEPKTWNFKLTRSVNLDVREAVKAYVREGARALTVQTMVRGHHKRQVHGPQGSLRKWIHVEPYWRGPEDAPITVHSRIVER